MKRYQLFGLQCLEIFKANASIISETINFVRLTNYPDNSCGGYDIQIEIIQEEKSCRTDVIQEFNRGGTLKWTRSNKTLGGCEKFVIDIGKKLSFKMLTPSYNDFCPEYLFMKLYNKVSFLSEQMSHWHDKSDNDVLYNLMKYNKYF